jgi:nucleoside-diphosphate-sugar epimerase
VIGGCGRIEGKIGIPTEEASRMAMYLVTGGAGFIGSNIASELLARGERVRVLDNFSTGREDNLADGIELVRVAAEGDRLAIGVTPARIDFIGLPAPEALRLAGFRV